jgi:hypothetical protein
MNIAKGAVYATKFLTAFMTNIFSKSHIIYFTHVALPSMQYESHLAVT